MKTIACRVTEQDFNTLNELANRLHQMQQTNHANPHLLAKEYCFPMANIVMKLHGWIQTSEQDQAVFALVRGMAESVGTQTPNQQNNG